MSLSGNPPHADESPHYMIPKRVQQRNWHLFVAVVLVFRLREIAHDRFVPTTQVMAFSLRRKQSESGEQQFEVFAIRSGNSSKGHIGPKYLPESRRRALAFRKMHYGSRNLALGRSPCLEQTSSHQVQERLMRCYHSC